MSKVANNLSNRIPRRSQRYFRPDMTEKKICMFFRIDEEKNQTLSHILETGEILDFMKQKQVDSYPVNGLEFTFNIPSVTVEEVKKMLAVIQLFSKTVEEITLRITNGLELSQNFELVLEEAIELQNQLSLTLDWKSITKVGHNEKMISFLSLFKQISSKEDIKKLNIQFAQVKSDAAKISNIMKFVTQLEKVEDLKIVFTHFIRNDAFSPLGSDLIEAQQSNMKKLELDFTNTSLGTNGSTYLASYIAGCTNLDSIRLNLRYNKLEDKDLIKILGSILDKKQVQNLHLSLSSNCFKEEGSNYLVSFLNNFASLSQLKVFSLDLKLFTIETDSISVSFFNAFSKLTELTQLTLNFQRIYIPNAKECLLVFSQSLGLMTQLKQLSIDLSHSQIKNEVTPLFAQIGNLSQLTHLQLGLLDIPFSDKKMKILESNIQQLKNLQMLSLNMDLINSYRGNRQEIYQNLISVIERELTPLMNFQLPEMDQMTSNYYMDVLKMYGRVQKKILLRKQLVYSILLLKKQFMIGKIKRKDMIKDFAEFLMQPNYFEKDATFIPPAPDILELL